MAWSQISNYQVSLEVGQAIQLTVQFGSIPFTSPTEANMMGALNQSGEFNVTSAKDTTPILTAVGAQWTIQGNMLKAISASELCAMVVNKLNYWNTWSVVVSKVETDVGLRPSDLLPSTTTATIWLVAIAALAVVGYLAFRRIT